MIKKDPRTKITVIESEEYQAEIDTLRRDLRIHNMGFDLFMGMVRGDLAYEKFADQDASPTFDFMMMINRRYRDLGGTQQLSIGGPAKAVLYEIDLLSTLVGDDWFTATDDQIAFAQGVRNDDQKGK